MYHPTHHWKTMGVVADRKGVNFISELFSLKTKIDVSLEILDNKSGEVKFSIPCM